MDKYEIKCPIGYLWLSEFLKKQGINAYPFYRESYLLEKGKSRVIEKKNFTQYYYTNRALKECDLWNNVEFALKNEGLNLEIFASLYDVLDQDEVKQYVGSKQNGKYNRIVWFLYEWLTEKQLDLPDINTRISIELLDSNIYYTSKPINHKRYAIKENLLGNKYFCPFVRKTNTLNHYDQIDLKEKIKKTIDSYDVGLIKRASAYLYYKETKSSNEIEREKPDKARTARFVNILERINQLDDLSKELLIEIQNTIVDPRYAQNDYRAWQNYVGQTVGLESQIIHYISPKGEDVESLMNGLLACYNRLKDSEMSPVLIAAIISFGFVFIHPFEDGNGRLHRFLIHYVLSKTNFAPPDIIFPISSTILNNLQKYDESLESFSKPLNQLINYELDDECKMTVAGKTDKYYKFIDMTKIAEYLYACISSTIEVEFVEELNFLINYDNARKEIIEIIDMPDQKTNLFITLCRQNKGILSENKRKSLFNELTNDEIQKLEAVCIKYFS